MKPCEGQGRLGGWRVAPEETPGRGLKPALDVRSLAPEPVAPEETPGRGLKLEWDVWPDGWPWSPRRKLRGAD